MNELRVMLVLLVVGVLGKIRGTVCAEGACGVLAWKCCGRGGWR